MNFDISVLIEQKDALLQGLLQTLAISGAGALGAIGIGLVVAVGRMSPFKPGRWLLGAYVQFFRNTPLLVHIYFLYKALPFLGIVFPAWMCGVLALSLQSGAYMAEIFRSGIEAIPREQFDSGRSLGFSRTQTFFTVILPQALAIMLPPTGNQMVGLIKNSSLVAFITVPDLFYVILNGGAAQFRYLEFFTVGIMLYMGLTLGVSGLFKVLERQVFSAHRLRESAYA